MRKITVFFLALLSAFALISFAQAMLDLRINAQLNDFDADMYIATDEYSSATFDAFDVEIKTFPSGNYSFLYSNITTKKLLIDSWPESNRTFNITYNVNPSSLGVLNISWNASEIGENYTIYIMDYGTDVTYVTNETAYIDMKTNESYSVSVDGAWRYFTIRIDITPVSSCISDCSGKSCGDDGCGGSCGTCTAGYSCSGGACIDTGGGSTGGGGADTCTDTCVSKGYNCGTVCGASCGNCGAGYTCSSGRCVLSCSDDCVTGSKECSGNSYRTCGNYDSDFCLEWSALTSCLANQICFSGNCISAGCVSDLECSAEEKCIGYKCILKTCDDTCVSKGYNCGIVCGASCGICRTGYNCISGKCAEGEKPDDDIIPVDIVKIGKEGCDYYFICGEWGACETKYDLLDIINSNRISGTMSRICADKNNCAAEFTQTQDCSLKENIFVENKAWCDNNYTEVKDLFGKVLARLKMTATGKSVSVDLNTEGIGYCAYCYNGVKDHDETEVDCGGSCIACSAKFIAAKKSYIIHLIISAILFLILFTLTLILLKKISNEFNLFYVGARTFGFKIHQHFRHHTEKIHRHIHHRLHRH